MPIDPALTPVVHRQAIPDLLEVELVAQKLSFSPDHVRDLIRTGKLPGHRFGNRWRVDAVDVLAFIRNAKVQIQQHERAIDRQLSSATRHVQDLRARSAKATAP